MTKARISIYTGIFLAFTLIGFALAYHFRDQNLSPVPAGAVVSSLPANEQQNLLVIHVDDLSKPDPRLISIWVVFFAEYDSHFISFKALYPDPLAPRPIIPVNVFFSLDENSAPSERLLKWVSDQGLVWSAYAVIDQQGMDQISDYLQATPLELIIPRNKDQFLTVWQQEAQLMNAICKHIQSNREDESKFDWNRLIPHHLHTDLSFENAILVWSRISIERTSPSCVVSGFQ